MRLDAPNLFRRLASLACCLAALLAVPLQASSADEPCAPPAEGCAG